MPAECCIEAAVTLTLALPKRGLVTEQARPVVGRLFVADISVPPAIYRRLGLGSLPFTQSTVVNQQLAYLSYVEISLGIKSPRLERTRPSLWRASNRWRW